MSRIHPISIKHLVSAQLMGRATDFYHNTFGFKILLTSEYWSEMDMMGNILAFHGGGDGRLNKVGISFTVPDIYIACEAVESNGGRIITPPEDRGVEGIYLSEFADTEGNILMLSQVKG